MPAIDIDKEEFERNLLLTQAYCELQLQKPFTNNAEVFRSFNPDIDGQKLFSFGKGKYNSYYWDQAVWAIDPIKNDYLYEQLFKDQMLNKQALGKIDGVYRGRILVADIDQTVTDGGSEAESDGFIDVYDCPPIDTWFHFINIEGNRMLFAWIPQQFEEAVQGAIDVNCVDCLGWYEDGGFFENRNVYIPQPQKHQEQKMRESLIDKLLKVFKR